MKISTIFTPAQREILANLHARDSEERCKGIREAISLKALRPAVARLLCVLVLQNGANIIVEFGTSHGYSTIHLAAAAERTDGHVYSVDEIPEKIALATENLGAAGLLHRVTLVTCDGAEFVNSLPDGIDFVLVDYGIPAFAPAFAGLREKIAPGGLIFIDGGPDGHWESDAVRGFKTSLEKDPAFLVSILPMQKVHLVAVRVVT